MLYDRSRYEWRGKFAETRFKRDCLAEYAEVFKTVCVDAAYYTFPSQQYLEGMVMQVPDDFQFGLKVTDTITIKKFPKLARFGDLAGKPNQNFLNAELFAKAFLHPCDSTRSNVGLLMFEFSRFWPTDYEHGRDRIKEENPEVRAAGRELIAEGCKAGPKRKTLIFVNHRLEGNALQTIGGMMGGAVGRDCPRCPPPRRQDYQTARRPKTPRFRPCFGLLGKAPGCAGASIQVSLSRRLSTITLRFTLHHLCNRSSRTT
jgi:hypothetical protein